MSVMILTGMSVLASVIVLAIHHRDSASRVPHWLHHFAFDLLSPVFCRVTLHTSELNALDAVIKSEHGSSAAPEVVSSVTDARSMDKLTRPGQPQDVMLSLQGDFNAIHKDLKDQMRRITIIIQRRGMQYLAHHEWRMVAKVFDRVLLIIYSVVLFGLIIFSYGITPLLY